jgi:2-polyprenyl-3-methyl-5-hydroxy-6-metoxy-1,4-benzoquinol methylase
MDPESIRRERDAIVEQHGPWTAHNVRLADGVYTISASPAGDEVKLRRVTQVVSDLLGGRFEGARILDLACLEGMYALELACRGADVVAIEGRKTNIEKARFAARTLGLDVDFRVGDVRDLSREEHGEFDVVLCLGILYHLDAPDLFPFVDRLAEVCRRALVVDTAVADRKRDTYTHDGVVYSGRRLVEHAPDSTEQERLDAVWSSLDNLSAFALTRPSLQSLLAHAGFTSVYECSIPAEPEKELHRVTYVALKGTPAGALLSPEPASEATTVPEVRPLKVALPASRVWAVGRHVVPRPLRARVRRLLGAETRRH